MALKARLDEIGDTARARACREHANGHRNERNGAHRPPRLACGSAAFAAPQAIRAPTTGSTSCTSTNSRAARRRPRTAGVRQHSRPLAWIVRRRRARKAILVGNSRIGFSALRKSRRRSVGRSWLRYRAGMHRQIPQAGPAAGIFRAGVKAGDRRRSGQGRPRLNIVGRRERRLYEPKTPPSAHGRLLHDQLSCAGREGRARRRSAFGTGRSRPSTIPPTPMWWSMRPTRTCGAPAPRCCPCSRQRPAARRRSR